MRGYIRSSYISNEHDRRRKHKLERNRRSFVSAGVIRPLGDVIALDWGEEGNVFRV